MDIILYLLQLIQQLYQQSLCQVLVARIPYYFAFVDNFLLKMAGVWKSISIHRVL